jgi:hypothetical protein
LKCQDGQGPNARSVESISANKSFSRGVEIAWPRTGDNRYRVCPCTLEPAPTARFPIERCSRIQTIGQSRYGCQLSRTTMTVTGNNTVITDPCSMADPARLSTLFANHGIAGIHGNHACNSSTSSSIITLPSCGKGSTPSSFLSKPMVSPTTAPTY